MRDATTGTKQVTQQRDLHVILQLSPWARRCVSPNSSRAPFSSRLQLKDEVDEALQHEQLKKLLPCSQEVAADCESAPFPVHH